MYIMYKAGDRVRFIMDDRLGTLSLKTATVVRRVDAGEVIVDEGYVGDRSVYEVSIPLSPNIMVLGDFIKLIKG